GGGQRLDVDEAIRGDSLGGEGRAIGFEDADVGGRDRRVGDVQADPLTRAAVEEEQADLAARRERRGQWCPECDPTSDLDKGRCAGWGHGEEVAGGRSLAGRGRDRE